MGRCDLEGVACTHLVLRMGQVDTRTREESYAYRFNRYRPYRIGEQNATISRLKGNRRINRQWSSALNRTGTK